MACVDPLHARSQGALRQSDGSVLWRIWAPFWKEVRLITWPDGQWRDTVMQAEGDGYFTHQSAAIPDGLRYAYRLDGVGTDLPDPASRWQPDGVHKPSAVFSPGEYRWHDENWQGVPPKELVIYELHVGTFTRGEGT